MLLLFFSGTTDDLVHVVWKGENSGHQIEEFSLGRSLGGTPQSPFRLLNLIHCFPSLRNKVRY